MNRFRLGIILTLFGSLVLGVLLGVIFHRLFLANVPQNVLSEFGSKSSPFTFVGTGLLAGVVICVWSLLVAWLAPAFRRGSKRQTPSK